MQQDPSKENNHSKDDIVPTDSRGLYEWQTHYPQEARKEFFLEGLYLFLLLLLSLFLIFLTWRNVISELLGLQGSAIVSFNKYAYYSVAGLLGGVVTGIKYHYHVVAKGRWHEDRRLWRVLSPWLSLGVAFGMGTLIEAGWVSLKGQSLQGHSAGFVAVGFLIGLFSDAALRMMQRIAEAVFGSSRDDKKD